MTLTDTNPTATVLPDNRLATPRAVLLGWDAIELWVGNARAVAGFLSSAFGFRVTAYAGPETGWSDRASYVLEQGRIRFVVTAALTPDSPIAAHVREHGDGVHNLALGVDDVDVTYRSAVARGARGIEEPHTDADRHGLLRSASIAIYGETRHTFVDRSSYRGVYLPGYTTDGLPPEPAGLPVGLTLVDHVVGNVELGALEQWVDFYRSVLGFDRLRHFDDAQISTEYSALMSTVVWDGSRIVLPLNEPAKGRRKSQIQEYIETYRGPGVQHIALHTDDIVQAVAALRSRGVRFLEAPTTYYDDVRRRLGHLDLPWDDLQRLGILVDEEPDGWLLQIFTETITDRPTVFLEIIQRGGAKGFGAGNFKALFEAIEREQARRGHL
ncbi:MAG: 4-hydroxyphenylpyruvate dioxygenase [Actinomycetota bacterium]|jgi:4-hydroxyphenylpyruvate dioxygenase|nr:4-hydroxyphenylpyruvate dioxygenase [Actinomycetota bacterium]MEA2972706.1 4-hydroxyphenylpyruvate dioxygenase [Actinomycetota bacterium]